MSNNTKLLFFKMLQDTFAKFLFLFICNQGLEEMGFSGQSFMEKMRGMQILERYVITMYLNLQCSQYKCKTNFL